MMQKVGMQRKPSSARSSSPTAWQPFLSAELSSCLGGSTFRSRRLAERSGCGFLQSYIDLRFIRLHRCHDQPESPVCTQAFLGSYRICRGTMSMHTSTPMHAAVHPASKKTKRHPGMLPKLMLATLPAILIGRTFQS